MSLICPGIYDLYVLIVYEWLVTAVRLVCDLFVPSVLMVGHICPDYCLFVVDHSSKASMHQVYMTWGVVNKKRSVE